MSATTDEVVMILVQFGIPSAVIGAISSAVAAWRKRKAMIAAAPDVKIDTSMSRMQQAAIVQDSLVDNLRETVEIQTRRAEAAERRAEAAERRERQLLDRLAAMQDQLDRNDAQLADTRRQLDTLRAQIPTPRPETP